MLLVKSQLFKLIHGMLSVACPTNTQKDGVKSHYFSTNKFTEVCVLPLCRLQLLSRPRVSQHLISISRWGCLMQLAVVVLSLGLCLLRNAWCERVEEGEEEVDLAWSHKFNA
eukprot:1160366-Pelagomonas_calceolata.AAC.12